MAAIMLVYVENSAAGPATLRDHVFQSHERA
jgi:hypothetical protein